MAISRQQKNFGPNVRYCVLCFTRIIFELIIWRIIRINIKLFSYLATCGWLFDGFFSHWQLAVESILQLANSSDSTIGRRIFGSGAWGRGSPLGPGGPAPLAKILRLIVEFANQTMNSTANGSRIHRITNHTCWTPFKGLSIFYFFSWLDPPFRGSR